MKLSPALLCRELSKLYPVSTDGPLSVEPVLTRPQLLEPGAAPAEGALCVAPAGEDWSAAADWGCIALLCESGIPQSVEDRMAVFEKIMAKAKEYGIAPNRLYIDPLVEAAATN